MKRKQVNPMDQKLKEVIVKGVLIYHNSYPSASDNLSVSDIEEESAVDENEELPTPQHPKSKKRPVTL